MTASTDQITDTVASRRMVARSVVPSNLDALRRHGYTVEDINGIEHRVAGKVAFFPRNGFWRFLDGSRQGYGASRLLPELSLGSILALAILDINSQKPAAGSLNISLPELTSQDTNAEPVAGPEKLAAGRDSMPEVASSIIPRSSDCAESAAGDCCASSSLLPGVWP